MLARQVVHKKTQLDIEVQFVCFRVKFADLCDILKRLYARPAGVVFSYLAEGNEVVVESEEDFMRCKEVRTDLTLHPPLRTPTPGPHPKPQTPIPEP